MAHKNTHSFPLRVVFGFIAGFLATLIFHQLTLVVLWYMGIAPFGPFPMAATQPFDIPAVFSLALNRLATIETKPMGRAAVVL